MQSSNDVREKLKKYYQSASGKAYDFGSDLYTNAKNSGVSGTKLEELKTKTRAHLNAYGAYEAADGNYDAALKSIENRRQNATELRDAQNAEADKIAMRQASVAGSNYELLKRYLPEYNAQSGKGNLGVGSGAYTDAYAAYMSALSESASSAADAKANVLQNYITAKSGLEQEIAEAQQNKLSAYATADRELSEALAAADEATNAKYREQNTSVKDYALNLMSYGANEDGTYAKASVDKAFNYVKEFATDETSAEEIIKQLKAETINNYDTEAMLEYGDEEYKAAYKAKWGRLGEGVDMERGNEYSLDFDGESTTVKLAKKSIKYDDLPTGLKQQINNLSNGDIVVLERGGLKGYYVVDDIGRTDVRPRIVEIRSWDNNFVEIMNKYAYRFKE